jgi:adenosine kinase
MARESGGKAALICGSVAYDTILLFQDRFKAHILPEYGGCAANIAYNLQLLGDRGLPMATVGHDFGPYRERLAALGVPVEHLRQMPDAFTAQAFITTDLDDNQITAFHPGAMQYAHLNTVGEALSGSGGAGISIGLVAPDGRQAMIEHAAQFAGAGIPFIFDPGQQLPVFGADELQTFIGQADWVAVNDYEWGMLQDKTGLTEAQIAARVKALIVTRGAAGSLIHVQGRTLEVPCAKPRSVVDPTGCGDAYRAGLIHGLLRGLDWETTGRVASLLGAIKIESRGPQNHRFTRAEFERRFAENFGYTP